MLSPTRRWAPVPTPSVSPELAAAAERHGVPPRVLHLLAARGCSRPEDLEAFVADPHAVLHDPALLPDAAALAERLARAREHGERVLVYGDFDADGLTALSVMVLALRHYGLAVEPYVPSRFTDGHGLSAAGVERAAADGCPVIVTVDCGSSSADEIALAARQGIDVLVTDHHHVPERWPGAAAVVNPQREDNRYPDTRLTGAGVAFKVAQLLLGGRDGGDAGWTGLADLAAIGTIADVAPLLGENRAIVRLGLDLLRDRPRPGLAALLEVAGVAPDRVDAEVVAYTIAPRLNAAGRIGEVTLASRLLMAADREEAAVLAGQLEEANRTRRDQTASALAEARAVVGDPGDAPALVLAGPWPAGLVGLVAGRLAEEHHRPAVVFSTQVEPWRGSGRSPAGALDLARAFAACGQHFVRYGGHPEAAGGDLIPGRLDPFREAFLALAAASPVERRDPDLRVDLSVPIAEVGYDLHRDLARLEPFGPGNPPPQVAVLGATVTRVRPVSNGHVQLTVSKGREVLDVIAFGRADLGARVAPGDRLDLVARIGSRHFGGYESLQLELLDAASAGRGLPSAPGVPER